MPPRNSAAKNKDVLKELEKTISPVLVVNNSSLKPYVELFEYSPENIYQQPLGNLVGFFEVKEYSDESAYIVNFLTSVLKKEYYINPKRPVTESLDSALHKINVALSELAKHGNISWLGKINAAICVLEKNNAHFSVSGNAKIFLYRNQNLSEISDGLATDELEPHPLKTFVNVSSGRLEKNDRLLITSADIFHILSSLELKKNFQRFEGEKFVQFLKTALSNQMEMIASMVIETNEPKSVAPKTAKIAATKKDSIEEVATINAFSEKTFTKPTTKNPLAIEEQAEIEELAQEINYTDKKTGHIYVQGDANENTEGGSNPQMGLYWDMFKEKISQGSYVTKNELRKRFYLYKKQLAKKKKIRQAEKEKRLAIEAEEKRLFEEQSAIQQAERAKQLELEMEQEKIRLEQEQLENQRLAEINRVEQKRLAKLEKIEQEKIKKHTTAPENKKVPSVLPKTIILKKSPADIEPDQKDFFQENVDSKKTHELSFLEKLRLAQLEENKKDSIENKTDFIEEKSIESNLKFEESEFEFEENFKEDEGLKKTNPKLEALKSFSQKAQQKALAISQKTILVAKTGFEKIKSSSKNSDTGRTMAFSAISPHFSKIGKLYSRLTKQQKMISLGALVLIFIVPIFIARYLNKPKPIVEVPKEIVVPTQAELLAGEKNINLNTQIQNIYSNSNIVANLVAGDTPVVITKTSAVVLSGSQPQEFQLPANFGTPSRAAFMNDLSLVLILSDSNKVLSFSPISFKFTENKIDLSGISSSSFIATYLTYMYVLDQNSNQILRFPRAEGGFGNKTNWLKDGTSLAETSDMTIDDNIYTIQGGQVLKFFKGQKQSFSLEASKTPVTYSKIFTTPDLQNIYVLDTTNSRIVSYSKDGLIIAQYYNEKLKDGTSLAISEKNKTAYVSTSEDLVSITLQ